MPLADTSLLLKNRNTLCIFHMVYEIKNLGSYIPLHGYHCTNGAVKCGLEIWRLYSEWMCGYSYKLVLCVSYIVRHIMQLVRTALKYAAVIMSKTFLFRAYKGLAATQHDI